MKRYEFEKAVYESGLNRTLKQILVYYGYKKNWNNDSQVWDSAVTVGKALDMSDRTVERAMPVLRDNGWLIDTGRRVIGRTGRPSIVYELAIGLSDTMSVKSTHNQPELSDTMSVKSDIEFIETEIVIRHHVGQVPELSDMSDELSDISAELSDTTPGEQGINKTKEQVKVLLPTPPEPVVEITEDEIRNESISSNNEFEDEVTPPKRACANINKLELINGLTRAIGFSGDFPSSVSDRAKELLLDPFFNPDEEATAIRVNSAIGKAWQEHSIGQESR